MKSFSMAKKKAIPVTIPVREHYCRTHMDPYDTIELKKLKLHKWLGHLWSFMRLFSGGGGESRTRVRERSTQGLYRFSLRTSFRLGRCPQTGFRQLSFRKLLARIPDGKDANQPNGFDTSAAYQASAAPA